MEIFKNIGITAVTSVVSIVVLFLLTKLMGSKQVSQMTAFDYIVGITIGSVAAELATDLEEPTQPLTALIIYGFAAFGISVLTSKSIRARGAVTGKPLILLEDGVIFRENLKKARLDLNEFLTYTRMSGYFDLSQVQTAVLEHNGVVSFLPKEPYRHALGHGPEAQAEPCADAVRHGWKAAAEKHRAGRQRGGLGPPDAA